MKKENIDVEDMDLFTLKRWTALIEGVNLIYTSAAKAGIAPDDVTLKQHHLLTYIDEITEKIRII